MNKHTPQEWADITGCYVAQDSSGNFFLYEDKPVRSLLYNFWQCRTGDRCCIFSKLIDVPADHDWTHLYEPRKENVRLEIIERDTYKHALEILTSRLASASKSHKTVADFKIINLEYKYKDIDDSSWYGASEYISRLAVYKGYEPYGYIQNTEKGPVQAMIKYKEES